MKEFDLRYSRQIAVPEIGKDGQKKLSEAKIMIVGCGALGSMIAMQLAAAGVGNIGIADFDNIEISNLQRQFFFTTQEAGKPKVEILCQRIKALNPFVEVQSYPCLVTSKNALEIFSRYDFIIDGTDNPETKRIAGEYAATMGKGCCIGGIGNFSGQVMIAGPGKSRFEDYFGMMPAWGFTPCSIGGVFGPAAALCASIQVSESLKYILEISHQQIGRLILFDLLAPSFKVLRLD